MKVLRKYLFHIQNSVFEGELTSSEFKTLKNEIQKIELEQTDSIIYYKITSIKAIKKENVNIDSSKYIIL